MSAPPPVTAPPDAYLSKVEQSLVDVLYVGIGATAIVGNSLILTVIVKYPRLRRRNDCFYLIACLAIADVFVGLGHTVAGVERLRQGPDAHSMQAVAHCVYRSMLIVVAVKLSQLMIASIALDRFIAFYDPVKYLGIDHCQFAAYCMLPSCVYAIVVGSMVFVGVDLDEKVTVCNAGASTVFFQYYWVGFSMVVAAFVVCAYVASLVLMRRRLAAVGNMQSTVAQQLARQSRVARAITWLLAAYAVLWVVPNAALVVTLLLNKQRAKMRIVYYIGLSSAINSALNVFIYSFKHRDFYSYLKLLVSRDDDPPYHLSVIRTRSTRESETAF